MNMFGRAEETGEKFERQNANHRGLESTRNIHYPQYLLWPCCGPQPHYHAGLLK